MWELSELGMEGAIEPISVVKVDHLPKNLMRWTNTAIEMDMNINGDVISIGINYTITADLPIQIEDMVIFAM